MGRVVDQRKLEVWRRRLADFEASGLSVAAFCRRENVGASRFYYWSGKVRDADAVGSKPSAGSAGRAASGSVAASRSGRSNRSVGASRDSAASLLGGESLGGEKAGSGARVEVFVGDSIRLSMPLGEPEVIAAVVQRLRTSERASPNAETPARATTGTATSAGAFRRIEVVSGR